VRRLAEQDEAGFADLLEHRVEVARTAEGESGAAELPDGVLILGAGLAVQTS
jgi:hypothetical protein